MNASPFAALKARWQTLAPREQFALGVGGWTVGLSLLWWLALSPALQTLRMADAQRAELDQRLQTMRALQTEANALQALAKVSGGEALRALEASVKQRFGSSAQLNVAGERATVTFKAASGDALAQWLAQARVNAHALPTEAKLTRGPAPTSTAAAAAPAMTMPLITWDGSIVLLLP